MRILRLMGGDGAPLIGGDGSELIDAAGAPYDTVPDSVTGARQVVVIRVPDSCDPSTYRTEPCPLCPPYWIASRTASIACEAAEMGIIRLVGGDGSLLMGGDGFPLIGGDGEEVTRSIVRTATYKSTISLEDAEHMAEIEAIALVKAAAINGCDPVYTGVADYTAECADGLYGDPVTREAEATSTVSQADADYLALVAATEAAEAALVCTVDPPTVYESTQEYTATCEEGTVGDDVTREATATSTVSQEAADAAALAEATAAALADLVCTPVAGDITFTATATASASCPVGSSGETVTATGFGTSSESQEAAETAAAIDALANAEAALVCVWSATATITATCDDGYSGAPQTATETATSLISQGEAQDAAEAAALAAANALLVCIRSPFTATAEFTASCPDGSTGDDVTASGYGESYVSQEEADDLAAADAEANATAAIVCVPDP